MHTMIVNTILIVVFFGVSTKAFTLEPNITIGDKTYFLSHLKKQFKTIKVEIPSNPAYGGERKVYFAFNMNVLLSKLLNIDFKSVKKDQFLVVDTKDKYLSHIPLIDFVSKGQAFLAYQEDSHSISAKKRTNNGLWSYLTNQGKKESPGPFYIVWDSTETYPTGWPYQVISMRVVNKKDIEYSSFNPVGQSKSVLKGYELFNTTCSACHSLYYHGAKGRAPDLGMVTSYLSSEDMTNIMRNGRGGMPAVSKTFSSFDVEAIIKYLKWVSTKSNRLKIEIE